MTILGEFAGDRVRATLTAHIAHVRLNRPEKMNALDPEMFDALIAAGRTVAQTRGVRVVVLSGAGRAFCAGLDTASFSRAPDPDEPPLAERTHGNTNRFQEVAMVWARCPVPVIAAVHGVCFGGGLQIASGADLRVCAPDARLSIMEMKWGLVPDMGGFALWRGLVRPDLLRELVYTNRELSGQEALTAGLVTFTDPDPLARAMAIAATIASRNPEAVREAKRLFTAMLDQPTDAILLAESEAQERVIRRPNQVEAVVAAMSGRPPVFSDD
ncbi:crotonase/enoyl-CoA hydratase family protein [Erythrobacteraceae bacterium CFH 75059]|uniref:crotonase/enoyl-CoA hydratase family protein n=1 Tax=Qipengyuania thermophila TaxID=2509361 RepID=UPI00101E99DD|nr:crotonase/enoyl-CoA hydratase family protein [Qipengyuania thermophila]TCD06785.1 crotonase/enoyl-CoA hydratase family protein [Erythrobacteraceae bacterium CFH 75059]